jgi:hypothetical protein
VKEEIEVPHLPAYPLSTLSKSARSTGGWTRCQATAIKQFLE